MVHVYSRLPCLSSQVKSPWPSSYSEFSSRNRDKRSRINRHKKKRKHKKKIKEQTKLEVAKQDIFVLTDDDTLQVQLQEQMQLEDTKDVDEEFLAFMKESVIHRIRWNKIKEQKRSRKKKT